MPGQTKFVGFDRKCIDCGNYYAADYIEFHQNERCLKKIFNCSKPPATTDKPSQTQFEKLTKGPNASTNPIVLPNVSKQSKSEKIRCPYCSSQVKSNKYQKHIDLKCPKKKQLKKVQLPKKRFKPTRSKPSASIECKNCKCQIPSSKYEKHLAQFCPQAKVKCSYCREVINRSIFQQHILLKHNKSSASRPIPTKAQIDAIMGRPAIGGITSNSKPYVKALALKRGIIPRKCRICGRIAMYNSGHCYTCGDK